MKILETQSAVLSNYEVLTHLSTARAKSGSTPQKHENVETVLKEITDYLSPHPPTAPTANQTPSPLPPYTQPNYTPSTLRALVQGLKQFSLTKAEVLMILNLRPLSLELLDCVVEECDERFTQDRQEMILQVVGDVLGREDEEYDIEANRDGEAVIGRRIEVGEEGNSG